MKQPLRYAGVVLAAIVGIGVAASVFNEQRASREHEAQVAQTAQRREARREERAHERAEALRTDSIELMPEMLRGLYLGMEESALRAARPSAAPDSRSTEPALRFLSETFENGAQVMYGVDRERGVLVQVQVLSLLPSIEAIGSHLASMNEAYGIPHGVFDCTGGNTAIATRRFTWRKSRAALADVFLIYGDRVSLTLYIAETEWLAGSLAQAGCSPVPRERIGEFPRADPEALRVREQGNTP